MNYFAGPRTYIILCSVWKRILSLISFTVLIIQVQLIHIPAAYASTTTAHLIPYLNCGHNDAPVKFESLSASYKLNERLLTIVGKGNTASNITSGYAIGTALAATVNLHHDHDDICSLIGGCPVNSGSIVVAKTFSFPPTIPAVDYMAKLELFNSANISIGCLSVKMELESHFLATASTVAPMAIALLAGAATTALQYFVAPESTNMKPSTAVGGSMRSPLAPTFMDVVSACQFAAISGQVSINYPLFYQSFVRNFGWALGEMDIPSLHPLIAKLQNSDHLNIDYLDESGSLNPSNDHQTFPSGPLIRLNADVDSPPKELVFNNTNNNNSNSINNSNNNSNIIPLTQVQHNETAEIETSNTFFTIGMRRYASQLGIPIHALFPTVFIISCILSCFALVLFAFVMISLEFVRFFHPARFDGPWRSSLWLFCGATLIRIYVLVHPGLISTAIHQLTLSNTNSFIQTLAIIILIFPGVILPFWLSFRISRHYVRFLSQSMKRRLPPPSPSTSTSSVAVSPSYLLFYRPMYNMFRANGNPAVMVALTMTKRTLSAIAIGITGPGLLQIFLLMLAEFPMLIIFIWKKPFASVQRSTWEIFASVVRINIVGGLFMFAFFPDSMHTVPGYYISAIQVFLFLSYAVVSIKKVFSIIKSWCKTSEVHPPIVGPHPPRRMSIDSSKSSITSPSSFGDRSHDRSSHHEPITLKTPMTAATRRDYPRPPELRVRFDHLEMSPSLIVHRSPALLTPSSDFDFENLSTDEKLDRLEEEFDEILSKVDKK